MFFKCSRSIKNRRLIIDTVEKNSYRVTYKFKILGFSDILVKNVESHNSPTFGVRP